MNFHAIRAIYFFEMARWWRTIGQSIASPVISTALYFVVFGSAIGSRITQIDGIGYGSFIVPGLIMLSVMQESVSNASFGIYFHRYNGTIYEILSAPIATAEILLGYVGAAATKSIILGLLILATASVLVPLTVAHPLLMFFFLVSAKSSIHMYSMMRYSLVIHVLLVLATIDRLRGRPLPAGRPLVYVSAVLAVLFVVLQLALIFRFTHGRWVG